MLTGFLVIFLVKLANELLEDRAHGMVVDAARTKIDFRVEKLFDECAKRVGFGKAWDAIAKLEIDQDVLNVGGEAVQIVQEILLELLLAAARLRSRKVNLDVL